MAAISLECFTSVVVAFDKLIQSLWERRVMYEGENTAEPITQMRNASHY